MNRLPHLALAWPFVVLAGLKLVFESCLGFAFSGPWRCWCRCDVYIRGCTHASDMSVPISTPRCAVSHAECHVLCHAICSVLCPASLQSCHMRCRVRRAVYGDVCSVVLFVVLSHVWCCTPSAAYCVWCCGQPQSKPCDHGSQR